MEDNQRLKFEKIRLYGPHLLNPKHVAHDAILLYGHQKHVYSVFHMDLEFEDDRRYHDDACA